MRSWADVGISVPYGASGELRTTCPACSPSRRKSRDVCLAVNADQHTWFCHHCGWKGGLYGRSLSSSLPPLPRPPAQPDERKQAALRRVWGEARPITAADPVDKYLHGRGIALPVAAIPAVLRYHAHLVYRYEDGQRSFHPAMLAFVHDANGQGVSIHRTYLTADGRKAAVDPVKKLMSPAIPGSTRGGAIRIHPAGEVLGVAEGVETALAAYLATATPVWATVCARGMAELIVPPEVRLVVVFGDNDTAGIDAARTLARRLLSERRRVKLLVPDRPGADWADLQEVAHA